MALIDNRTALSGFETGDPLAQPDDLSGAPGGTPDTEIFIEGARSYGYYTTTSRDGLLYDAGSAQDWSSNTFYMWVNCGIAGLLDTKANGGLAVRFCGATVTNWFEANLAGADVYPAAISGGWVMFVVDIEKAKTASDRTGGTPPVTTAIRYVGVTTITGGTMPRMADNTWLDKMWRLPASTPGILVEGQTGGAADWAWADIQAASDSNAWGTFKLVAGGGYACNTPLRFGANDAVTHGFDDTNGIVLWEDWDVDAAFYGIEVIGGSGAQSFQLGVKTGTGDSASGSQGGGISAAATGQRFFFTADDANVDTCNLYGVTFQHGADFQLDSALVSVIGSTFVDCSSATISNAGDFLRCLIVDANTTTGTAFLTTDDLSDVVFCTFTFSAGHAVELTTPLVAIQASKGNIFNSYGITTSNDAAIYNNTVGAVTINVSDAGDSPTYRDGTSASTIIVNSVTVGVTAVDSAGSPIENARVLLKVSTGGPAPYKASVTITQSAGTATVTHTTHGYSTGQKVLIEDSTLNVYNGVKTITVTTASAYTYTIDSGTASPATGTIVSTAVILFGLTNASGVIENTGYDFVSAQDVEGEVKKGTSVPVYVPAPLSGTIVSGTGLSVTAPMGDD